MNGRSNAKGLPWLRQVSSFFAPRVILTANHYRIFSLLEGNGKTAVALSRAAATDPRATGLLLNSLVAIGLLEKKGGVYKNTPLASQYLVEGRPDYQGDILDHYSVLWDNWSGLDAVVKTGRPFRKSHDHRSFILGMHNIASQKVGKVKDKLDLSGVKRLLDLGGGPGTYARVFAEMGIEVTLFDIPETLKIAKGLIEEAGLKKRVKLLPGDFTKDELGSGYDMVFISQIFHAYSEDECLSMLEKCYGSLNPGGRVAVQEFHLEENRTSPLQGALFAINMLVHTPAGRTYTPKEISVWMTKAGFRGIRESVADDTVLITGIKKHPKK